jgi:ribosomal protein S18 acetylase RimI-like enzyme
MPEDFEQVLEIVRLETKVEPSEFEYHTYLSRKDKEHFVVEMNKQVICLISFSDVVINGERGLYFFSQMNPNFHDRGVGRHLYRFILHRMAEEYQQGKPIQLLQACCHGDRPQLLKFFIKMGGKVAHAYQTMSMRMERFRGRASFSPEYQLSVFDEERDLEGYYLLERGIFTDYFTYRPKSFEEFKQFTQSLSFQSNNIYLLHKQGEMIGFCQNQFVSPEKYHVILLGIHQDHRGKGLGHKLLMHSLAQGRAKGADEAMLAVDFDNEAALALYNHVGFQVIKQRYILEKRFDEATLLAELEEYGMFVLD